VHQKETEVEKECNKTRREQLTPGDLRPLPPKAKAN